MSKARKIFKITAWPGDGIGTSVTQSAFQVLNQTARLFGKFELNTTWVDWGCSFYEQNGQCVPETFLDQLRDQDAIFLGAIGMPSKIPDHISLTPLVELRQGFDLYACVRPARTYTNVPTHLKSTDTNPVDMIVVRENTEGEYIKRGGFFKEGSPEEYAVQEAVHTRKGIERVLRFGFELARKPERRKKLTMITKSNALVYGAVLWDRIFDELCSEYSDIVAEKQHVDAAAMNFVLRPHEFDVVVASNLFGDILTDLSGSITGSLGLNPSANLDPTRQYPSLFEPVHGSAPDIDGLGVANPTGAILASAQMLNWIDPDGFHCGVAPKAIELAISNQLSSGRTTKDLGGNLSTDDFTSEVMDELESIYTGHCRGEITFK